MKLLSLSLLCLPALAQLANFVPAFTCSQIHCTSHEDDANSIPPPISNFGFLFQDTAASGGSGPGLGCSTDGVRQYCIYSTAQTSQGFTGILLVYNNVGQILWTDQTQGTSGSNIGTGACSAPIVGSDGGVMEADQTQINRYDVNGNILWHTALPYHGVTGAAGLSDYHCGGIKSLTNGLAVIKTLYGPMIAINTSTGAIVGPPSCTGTQPQCALWLGLTPGTTPSYTTTLSITSGSSAATITGSTTGIVTGQTVVGTGIPSGTSAGGTTATVSGTSVTLSANATTTATETVTFANQYWYPVKEGGCGTTPTDPTPNRVYTAVQGSGGALPTSTATLFAVDANTSTGLSIGAQSNTNFGAMAGASPMCSTVSGNTVVMFADNTCLSGAPNGCTPAQTAALSAAVLEFIDNGSVLNLASGFPVTAAKLTAAAAGAQSITGGSQSGSDVTFNVANTAGCAVGQSAYVTGNSVPAYNGNWAIVTGGVTSSSIKVLITGSSGAPGANGTLTCNNAGQINSNFALDSRNCAWLYVKSVNHVDCVDVSTGAIDYTQNFPVGFVPGTILAQTTPSDRTMSINPANSHNIMMLTLQTGGSAITSYEVAVDVNTGTLLWYWTNPSTAAGQFPVFLSSIGLPIVTFTNNTAGITMLNGGGFSQR